MFGSKSVHIWGDDHDRQPNHIDHNCYHTTDALHDNLHINQSSPTPNQFVNAFESKSKLILGFIKLF